ncbi:hypothetical protein DFH09DRAFT_1458978 [Mycena vulgaris]|nr:hypothetical protein DFH09DRAFT_1458978 [Mycena vulgaris]
MNNTATCERKQVSPSIILHPPSLGGFRITVVGLDFRYPETRAFAPRVRVLVELARAFQSDSNKMRADTGGNPKYLRLTVAEKGNLQGAPPPHPPQSNPWRKGTEERHRQEGGGEKDRSDARAGEPQGREREARGIDRAVCSCIVAPMQRSCIYIRASPPLRCIGWREPPSFSDFFWRGVGRGQKETGGDGCIVPNGGAGVGETTKAARTIVAVGAWCGGNARQAEAARGIAHGAGEGEDRIVRDGEGERRVPCMREVVRGECGMDRRRAEAAKTVDACEEVTETTWATRDADVDAARAVDGARRVLCARRRGGERGRGEGAGGGRRERAARGGYSRGCGTMSSRGRGGRWAAGVIMTARREQFMAHASVRSSGRVARRMAWARTAAA